MSEASSPKRVTRRTVAKGAAWTVPAIAVATPAHAAAQSGIIIIEAEGGQACKFSGASCSPYFQAYRFVFCFTNNSGSEITVDFPNLHVNGQDNLNPIPSSIDVPGDGVRRCYYIISDDQGNSANGEGYLEYEYEFGGQTYSGQVSTEASNDIPPCEDCSDTYVN